MSVRSFQRPKAGDSLIEGAGPAAFLGTIRATLRLFESLFTLHPFFQSI